MLPYQSVSSFSIVTELNVRVEISSFEIQDSIESTIIIGSEIAQEYLIKAKKYSKEQNVIIEKTWDKEIVEIDNEVYKISRKLNLSSILKPENYFSELDEFIKNPHEYNPVFSYRFPTHEKITLIENGLENITKKVANIKGTNKELYCIYNEKIDELRNKLCLVKAYKNEDLPKIYEYNEHLF
jgi:hypothetical protein